MSAVPRARGLTDPANLRLACISEAEAPGEETSMNRNDLDGLGSRRRTVVMTGAAPAEAASPSRQHL
jgi:hypothetical protein